MGYGSVAGYRSVHVKEEKRKEMQLYFPEYVRCSFGHESKRNVLGYVTFFFGFKKDCNDVGKILDNFNFEEN